VTTPDPPAFAAHAAASTTGAPAIAGADAPQPLLGYRTNDEWDHLLDRTQQALEALDRMPDTEVRAQVTDLLEAVDSVHREALHRLVRLFKPGVLEQVATDPTIHTLLELYDLLPPPPPAAAMAPAEPKARAEPQAVPLRFMRRAAPVAPAGAGLSMPHWLPAPTSLDELPEAGTRLVEAEGRTWLLARVRQHAFALEARCAVDGRVMSGATLKHYTLVCPHHPGCFYDLRSGKRLGGGGAVEPLAVRVNDSGKLLLGIGVPYVPPVPTM